MNIKVASNYTTLSERTLRYLIADRKLRVTKVGRRNILRKVDLDRFIESGLN